LLIGGPNQSHKVNFKELLFRGKSSIKPFRVTFVKNFSETFFRNFLLEAADLLPVKELFSPPQRYTLLAERKSSTQSVYRAFVKSFSELSFRSFPSRLPKLVQ
jgi:hypothetical protein